MRIPSRAIIRIDGNKVTIQSGKIKYKGELSKIKRAHLMDIKFESIIPNIYKYRMTIKNLKRDWGKKRKPKRKKLFWAEAQARRWALDHIS